jgi:hypothetical protein
VTPESEARYAAVAERVLGLPWVLEVGCPDLDGTRRVSESVGDTLTVLDPRLTLKQINGFLWRWPKMELKEHDLLEAPLPTYDAVYQVDQPAPSAQLLTHIAASLGPAGLYVLTPPRPAPYAQYFHVVEETDAAVVCRGPRR